MKNSNNHNNTQDMNIDTSTIITENHFLYCGDCLEVMPTIQSGIVDLVIADPPYFKVVGEKWDYQWRTEKEYIEWCRKWFGEVYRLLRYGGTF